MIRKTRKFGHRSEWPEHSKASQYGQVRKEWNYRNNAEGNNDEDRYARGPLINPKAIILIKHSATKIAMKKFSAISIMIIQHSINESKEDLEDMSRIKLLLKDDSIGINPNDLGV
eukprot:scaffold5936_cov268-Chaetoceros_neogracile.AAC.7